MDTVKEIAAGSFGGVIQVLVGQPFDTIKVRLQSQSSTQPQYSGTVDCVRKTIQNEGFSALYKGTLSPLVGIAFCVSIQFATLEHMKRTFALANQKQQISHLTPLQLYLSGGVAGLANSFVSGPVEHIRTRMQVQSSSSSVKYNSTFDCARQIFKNHGLTGIYKGQFVTMIREWQGYAGYFWAYELLVQNTLKNTGKKASDLPVWQIMSFGAAAGYVMWIPIFPIDSIKSRIQTDSFDIKNRQYSGIFDCFRKTIRAEGIAGLYKGFLPCMLRAAPVNAATFVAYEFAMRMLNSNR